MAKKLFLREIKYALVKGKTIHIISARICSNHFQELSWTLRARLGFASNRDNLLETAVPTLSLPELKNPLEDESIRADTIKIDNFEELPEKTKQDIANILRGYRTELAAKSNNMCLLSNQQELLSAHNENQVNRAVALAEQSLLIKLGFNEDQIQSIRSGKRVVWGADTVSKALSFRNVAGANAYEMLRKTFGYPLPCASTLKKWSTILKISPGILTDVLDLMKKRVVL